MSTFSSEVFGKRVRLRRNKIGLKRQQDLADLCKVSLQSINYYESGYRLPDVRVLRELATNLKCSSDYLIQLEHAADHDKAYIVDETGLSEAAVEVLSKMQKRSMESYTVPDGIELMALSTLLESKHIKNFLLTLYYFLFDDPSKISLLINGETKDYSLNDVIMIPIGDRNQNTTHGIFKEDLSKTLQTARLNQLQRILIGFREDLLKDSKHNEDTPEKLIKAKEKLTQLRLDAQEELEKNG